MTKYVSYCKKWDSHNMAHRFSTKQKKNKHVWLRPFAPKRKKKGPKRNTSQRVCGDHDVDEKAKVNMHQIVARTASDNTQHHTFPNTYHFWTRTCFVALPLIFSEQTSKMEMPLGSWNIPNERACGKHEKPSTSKIKTRNPTIFTNKFTNINPKVLRKKSRGWIGSALLIINVHTCTCE